MKFLLVAALVAVAAAYPSEEVRNRRSAVWGGVAPIAPGAVVQGASAVLHGPSAVLHANTGAIHTAAHAPAATAVVAPAWGHAGLVAAPHWGAWGGAVVGHHGAVYGHPGAVLLG